VRRLRLAADQHKVILGHAEQRGRFTAEWQAGIGSQEQQRPV
jgi:hypothetical protein